MYDKSDRDHFSLMREIARLRTKMREIAVSRVPLLPKYIFILCVIIEPLFLPYMQSCQNDLTGKGLAYVAKNTVPAKWNVAKLSPLQFVVVYGGGDQSKGPVLTRCVINK